MQIKILIWVIIIFNLNTPKIHAKEHLHIPRDFTITEQRGHKNANFEINSNSTNIALVYHTPQTYDLYCPLGHHISSAQIKTFKHYYIFEIIDENAYSLGTLEKSLNEIKGNFYLSSNTTKTPIAFAKFNNLHNEINILDPDTKGIMLKVYRPIKKSNPMWSVSITNPLLLNQKKIEERLLLISLVLLVDTINNAAFQHNKISRNSNILTLM